MHSVWNINSFRQHRHAGPGRWGAGLSEGWIEVQATVTMAFLSLSLFFSDGSDRSNTHMWDVHSIVHPERAMLQCDYPPLASSRGAQAYYSIDRMLFYPSPYLNTKTLSIEWESTMKGESGT